MSVRDVAAPAPANFKPRFCPRHSSVMLRFTLSTCLPVTADVMRLWVSPSMFCGPRCVFSRFSATSNYDLGTHPSIVDVSVP